MVSMHLNGTRLQLVLERDLRGNLQEKHCKGCCLEDFGCNYSRRSSMGVYEELGRNVDHNYFFQFDQTGALLLSRESME